MVEANPVASPQSLCKVDKTLFDTEETVKAIKVPVRWIQEFSKKVSIEPPVN